LLTYVCQCREVGWPQERDGRRPTTPPSCSWSWSLC